MPIKIIIYIRFYSKWYWSSFGADSDSNTVFSRMRIHFSDLYSPIFETINLQEESTHSHFMPLLLLLLFLSNILKTSFQFWLFCCSESHGLEHLNLCLFMDDAHEQANNNISKIIY